IVPFTTKRLVSSSHSAEAGVTCICPAVADVEPGGALAPGGGATPGAGGGIASGGAWGDPLGDGGKVGVGLVTPGDPGVATDPNVGLVVVAVALTRAVFLVPPSSLVTTKTTMAATITRATR